MQQLILIIRFLKIIIFQQISASMKIAKLLGACLVVAIVVLSCKKNETPVVTNQLNDADSIFIRLAGYSNFAEVETAKVAISKSTDSLLLVFAQQMLAEHTKAQNDLKTMGTIVGFTVKDSIDTAHAATIARLDTLTGRTFDSTYIYAQLADHDSMTNFYTDEIKNGRQMNVRAYAGSILQNIQADQVLADSVVATLK